MKAITVPFETVLETKRYAFITILDSADLEIALSDADDGRRVVVE